jgi:hypothetical protein
MSLYVFLVVRVGPIYVLTYHKHKLSFRSKRCVFLGYSPRHKGVKCLDVSTSRVFISCDVVFDENIFPFASLHPNAGRCLREEIMLLSETASPSSSDDRGVHTNVQYLHIVLVVDLLQVTAEVSSSQNSGQNSAQNSENNTSNNATAAAPETADSVDPELQNLSGITPLTRMVKIPLCAVVEALLHTSRRRDPALLMRQEEIPLIRPRPLAT